MDAVFTRSLKLYDDTPVYCIYASLGYLEIIIFKLKNHLKKVQTVLSNLNVICACVFLVCFMYYLCAERFLDELRARLS